MDGHHRKATAVEVGFELTRRDEFQTVQEGALCALNYAYVEKDMFIVYAQAYKRHSGTQLTWAEKTWLARDLSPFNARYQEILASHFGITHDDKNGTQVQNRMMGMPTDEQQQLWEWAKTVVDREILAEYAMQLVRG